MGVFKLIARVLRVGEAEATSHVEGLEQAKALELEGLAIQDATEELKKVTAAIGRLDGEILSAQDVDKLVDEKGALEGKRDKYLTLIKQAQDAGDTTKVAQLKGLAAKTIGKLKKTEADLAAAETKLKQRESEYEAALAKVETLNDELDEARGEHRSAGRELDMAKVEQATAEALSGLQDGGTTAFGKLRDATEARRRKVNEELGKARTVRRLSSTDDLEAEIDKQIETDANLAEVDALLAAK